MEVHTDRKDNIKQLAKLIKGIKFAMFSTVEDDGTIRSRPMATQEVEFDGELWFFTWADSPKVDEVQHERHVNVSYAKPDDQLYISVSGTARLVRDKQKIEELWSPALKAWFPKGKDDPNVALLQVQVEQAEYWDSPSSPVAHAVSFAKAIATGQTAQPGENVKMEFDQPHQAQ